ncbi:cache domain-containing protein [uncultured Methanocorpusculum sp.]|nr:cache domain-containing protein [uncultured Methanocorpusculum sp.]
MIHRAFSKILFILIVLLLISASGCIIPQNTPTLQPVSEEYYAEMDAALYPYMQSIDEQMKETTAAVWNAARELDGMPKDGPEIDLALLKLKSEIPLSYEAGRVDKDNILTAITGEQNSQQLVGEEIVTTPYTEDDLRAAGSACVVSNFVTFQNGERGVKVIAPVYDAEGNYDGTLQVSLNIESLFSGPADELREKYGYTVWAAQENGVMLYNEEMTDIGSDLTNPSSAYTPSFTSAAKDILANESGHTSYIFYSAAWHNISQTNVVWNTLEPGYGQTWRIVLTDNTPIPHEIAEQTITPEELKAFVTNAYLYAQKEGKTAALAAFNDPKGPFIDGELYIFAGGMDGTVLSVPYQPGLIGANAWFAEDPAGVKYVQRVIARAEQGGGYVLYLYPNPSVGYSTELKLSYVIPVDNEWYLGAGLYEHNAPFSHTTYVDWKMRNELIKQVRTMRYLAAVEGIPAVELALLKLRRDIPFSFEAGLFDMNDTLIASTEDLGKTMEIGVGKATNHYTEEELKAAGPACIVSGYSRLLFEDNGVTITSPVYDAKGNYNGTLRVGINTWSLFSGRDEYLRNEYGYTLWVAQPDGLVIYDKDTEKIGRNLYTDALYQTSSLQDAVKTICEDQSGNASYFFYDSTRVNLSQTNVVWDTVFPGYGMEWRLVLADYVPEKTTTETTETPTMEELKSFVERAYVYTQTHTKEEALSAFNDQNGEFVDGELYIFAYGMDGETLSLPFQPGLIGVNRWIREDPNGIKILQRMAARAQQGGGYVYYMGPNPDHDYAQEFKLSYVMPVDETWLIGAGIYVQDNPLSQNQYISWTKHDDLTYQVRNMQYLAKTEGVSSVIEMIKDPDSELQIEGLYPFAVTENGTDLADALNPEMAGTNQLGMTNSLGMSITREVISLTQAGGGWMYCLWSIPPTNEEEYVLIYVEPLDASVYVGSLIILE